MNKNIRQRVKRASQKG